MTGDSSHDHTNRHRNPPQREPGDRHRVNPPRHARDRTRRPRLII